MQSEAPLSHHLFVVLAHAVRRRADLRRPYDACGIWIQEPGALVPPRSLAFHGSWWNLLLPGHPLSDQAAESVERGGRGHRGRTAGHARPSVAKESPG